MGPATPGVVVDPLAHRGRIQGQPPAAGAPTLLSAGQVLQKLPRIAQQLPNPPSLFACFLCVKPVFYGVLIAFWRTRAKPAAVHAATVFAVNRGRPARTARPRSRTAARARQHRPGATDAFCHCALLPRARPAPRCAKAQWPTSERPVSGSAPTAKPASSLMGSHARAVSPCRRWLG